LRGLRVEGLRVELRGATILDGVSFTAPAGEVTVVLGPNGSGKTTLLRTVAGLLEPAGGRVLLDGVELHRLPQRERARLAAYAPPEPGRGLGQAAAEYVAAGLYPWLPPGLGIPRAALEEAVRLLEELEAGRLAWRSLSLLSSGEAQRAALAHAAARRPRLLAVDEPTAHQDLRGWRLAARLIRRMAEAGAAVLVATHDLVFASLYGDRLVALKEGRVAAEGPVGETLTPSLVEDLYGVEPVEATLPGGRRVLLPGPG